MDFFPSKFIFQFLKKQACITEVTRLPTVFLTNKLSNYRLKPAKYIVLRTPKKADKSEKNGQNPF